MKRLALALMLASACAAALAHRFQMGISDLSFNQHNGSIEVVHTFMAHDIEALLSKLAGRQVDLGSSPDEALLRQYLDQHFYLLDQDGGRLPLEWIGMKAGLDSVVLYQELKNTTPSQVAQVHDDVLADVLPRQVNTVNVSIDGVLRSLAFDAKTSQRRIR
ncbi:MAG: DUF6702 family protein [Pseudomonadota bacterium]